MKRIAGFSSMFLAVVCFADSGMPRSHLVLQSAKDRRNAYNVALRKVFQRIYADDVVLSALFVPSFIPEVASGILKSAEGYELFALEPSASTWETEDDRIMEYDRLTSGVREYCSDTNGKRIPCPPVIRRKGLPRSYHEIRTTLSTRPISSGVAERIKQLWQAKLLEALHPPPDRGDRIFMVDGATCHYSMRLSGYGLVTAEGIFGDKGTVVQAIGDLANAMLDYVAGRVSEDALKEALLNAEKKKGRIYGGNQHN